METTKDTAEFSVMDKDGGDVKVTWDPTNAQEHEAAKAQFDALRSQGFVAYAVDDSGNAGSVITTLDPRPVDKVILRPAMQGG